jgi:cyclic pyranopterin phosphate synthase
VIRDTFARPLRNLRLSVTDRCNLRCAYCMPEEEYAWLPRADILTFEEIARLVDVFAGLGVDKVRFTGGEPLLRKDLPRLVKMIAAEPRIRDLAITTNGILLAQEAQALRDAGIQRVTVSLDTLKPDRFRALTRRDAYPQVIEGIEAVSRMGWPGLKLDTVVMRGVNDDEIADLIEFARRMGAELRFIEYMDVGGATRWSMDQVVSRADILERLGQRYGRIEAIVEESSAPANRFRLPDGLTFGIISSTTAPFCQTCDRSRLTADGQWFLCLYATAGIDLRKYLRDGSSNDDLAGLIRSAWEERRDRGAEERLLLKNRQPLVQIGELKAKPHLEMHTRGG